MGFSIFFRAVAINNLGMDIGDKKGRLTPYALLFLHLYIVLNSATTIHSLSIEIWLHKEKKV